MMIASALTDFWDTTPRTASAVFISRWQTQPHALLRYLLRGARTSEALAHPAGEWLGNSRTPSSSTIHSTSWQRVLHQSSPDDVGCRWRRNQRCRCSPHQLGPHHQHDKVLLRQCPVQPIRAEAPRGWMISVIRDAPRVNGGGHRLLGLSPRRLATVSQAPRPRPRVSHAVAPLPRLQDHRAGHRRQKRDTRSLKDQHRRFQQFDPEAEHHPLALRIQIGRLVGHLHRRRRRRRRERHHPAEPRELPRRVRRYEPAVWRQPATRQHPCFTPTNRRGRERAVDDPIRIYGGTTESALAPPPFTQLSAEKCSLR